MSKSCIAKMILKEAVAFTWKINIIQFYVKNLHDFVLFLLTTLNVYQSQKKQN